jgi:hypothetical protein
LSKLFQCLSFFVFLFFYKKTFLDFTTFSYLKIREKPSITP